jgi:hypothetical protein
MHTNFSNPRKDNAMTYNDELLTTYQPIDATTSMVEIERGGRTYRAFYERRTDLAVMLFEHGFAWYEIEAVLSDLDAIAELDEPPAWPWWTMAAFGAALGVLLTL